MRTAGARPPEGDAARDTFLSRHFGGCAVVTRSPSPEKRSSRDQLTGLTDMLERLATDTVSGGPDTVAGATIAEHVGLADISADVDSPGPSTGGGATPLQPDEAELPAVSFGQQAFATLSSLFAGDTWVPTTGWAWSECSARPPKEQSAAEAARSAAVVDKTDDTPSLTVVPLADSSDPHGSESSKQWPDAGDTSSSFLEAALMVLCCHAPGGNLSKAAIFINADEGGQQCTFYGSFDSLGGLAALHELDECSAECARSAIRARIGMSQTERDAADALLEDLRAALLDGATDGSPAAAVADVVAEVDACTFAEDPLDEAAIVQTVTRAERRCITGMSASVHSAVGMLLVEAPKQDVTAASLRDLLNGASTDVIALHSSFGHMQRRLEGRLDKLGLGQDAVARLKAQARAAVEEMESASSQAQAVLKRAAGLTIFIMVAGKLKKTLTA